MTNFDKQTEFMNSKVKIKPIIYPGGMGSGRKSWPLHMKPLRRSMKIKVEVKNDILGDSIFWEGDSKDIEEIQNVVARDIAKLVAIDGNSRSIGMWVVTEVKED